MDPSVAIFALVALTLMEIVLGIDNIVFITIVSSKLPKEQQPLARKLGLMLALGSRLALLFTLSYIVKELTFPLFNLTSLAIPEVLITKLSNTTVGTEAFVEANGISWKDIILGLGGLFLIGKSVYEIHDQFNHADHEVKPSRKGFIGVLIQIAILDIIFSLDSIITAVGMVDPDQVWIMVTAIVLAVIVMLVFSEPVSRFVSANPTLKMLALSFLILIGVMLVAESVGAHLDKGYIYFAMAFALIVEFLNLRLRKKGGNKNKGQS